MADNIQNNRVSPEVENAIHRKLRIMNLSDIVEDRGVFILKYANRPDKYFFPEDLSSTNPANFLYAYGLFQDIQEALKAPTIRISIDNAYKKISASLDEAKLSQIKNRAQFILNQLKNDKNELEDEVDYERDPFQIDEEKNQEMLDEFMREDEKNRRKRLYTSLDESNRKFVKKSPLGKAQDALNTQKRKLYEEFENASFGDIVSGKVQIPEFKSRKANTLALDPETILRHHQNLDPKFWKYLPDAQREILEKLGTPKSVSREYIKYKANKQLDKAIDKYTERNGKGSNFLKKIQKERKRENKAVLTATKDLIVGGIRNRIKLAKDMIIGSAMKLPGVRNTVGGIKTSLSKISTGASSRWNNLKMSGTGQFIARSADGTIKSINFMKGIANGTKHLLKGIGTGALLALPLYATGYGALVPFVLAGGGVAGTINSVAKSAYAMNLLQNPGRQFEFLSKIPGVASFQKWQVKLALNNPNNWVKIGEISKYTKNDLVKNVIREEQLLTKGVGSLKNYRMMQNGFRSTSFGIGAFTAAMIFSGGNLALAGAIGAGAAGVNYAVRHLADDAIAKVINANPNLLKLSKFPAGALLNVPLGAHSIAEQVKIIQEGGFDAFLDAQKQSLFGIVPGSTGISNLLNTIGYATGTAQLTNWLGTVATKMAILPGPIKYAALLAPATLILGSIFLGWEISLGMMLAATGLGIATTLIALLAGVPTGGLGTLAIMGANVGITALFKSTGWLDRIGGKIDDMIGAGTQALGGLGIFDIINLGKMAQNINKLLMAPITSITGYAIALPIVISLITSSNIMKAVFTFDTNSAQHPLPPTGGNVSSYIPNEELIALDANGDQILGLNIEECYQDINSEECITKLLNNNELYP